MFVVVYMLQVCQLRYNWRDFTNDRHFSFSCEFSVCNSGNFIGPDAGVGGVSKRAHEESDSSPGSPAPLAIVESPEPPEQQPSQSKRQRIHEMDDHWTDTYT